MKKLQSFIALLFVSFFVFSACKKATDNPQPSGVVNGYRVHSISYYDSTGSTLSGTSTYSYDDKHRCIGSFTTTQNGYFTETEVYQYDDNDQVIFYSHVETDDTVAYRFSYTSDHLVAHTQEYNSLPATTVYKNIYSVYDSNRNMICQTVVLADSLHGDSTTYNNYSNSRPADAITYRWNGNAYQVYQKYKYTYDGRMNRIKQEATSPGHDQTVYDEVSQWTYQVVSNETQLDNLGGPQNISIEESGDDINLYSANSDKDFVVANSYSMACGLETQFNYSIEQNNDAGFPVKYRTIFHDYNCGVLSSDHGNTLEVFQYETY